MKKSVLLAVVILLAASLGLSACGSGTSEAAKGEGDAQAENTLRLALNQTEDHPSFIALDNFGDRLKERTGGAYDIDVYPNETLGAQQEALLLVNENVIDLAIVSGPQLENLNEDFKVFNLPKVFDDVEHQMRVVHDKAIVGELYASLEQDNNTTVLGGFTQGARSIYSAKGPVETPADMGGQKIRVQESDLFVQMIQAMGGSATPMAYGEVYTALQSGVLDGAENNEVSYFTQKHFEVAPYYSYTNHLVGLDYLIMNTGVLAEMTPEQRRIFDEEWANTYQEHTELWLAATKDAIDSATEAGATFVDIDPAPFTKALQPLIDNSLTTDTQRSVYKATREAAK